MSDSTSCGGVWCGDALYSGAFKGAQSRCLQAASSGIPGGAPLIGGWAGPIVCIRVEAGRGFCNERRCPTVGSERQRGLRGCRLQHSLGRRRGGRRGGGRRRGGRRGGGRGTRVTRERRATLEERARRATLLLRCPDLLRVCLESGRGRGSKAGGWEQGWGEACRLTLTLTLTLTRKAAHRILVGRRRRRGWPLRGGLKDACGRGLPGRWRRRQ